MFFIFDSFPNFILLLANPMHPCFIDKQINQNANTLGNPTWFYVSVGCYQSIKYSVIFFHSQSIDQGSIYNLRTAFNCEIAELVNGKSEMK